MASLNELAEILAERAGKQFDPLFNEEMKALIFIWDSRLTRDTLERNKQDRTFFRQYLEVPLQIVNISELPGFPDTPVLRTECTIPKPLRANGIAFDYVGSPDKLSPFRVYTEQHELIPALNARYTGEKPKALWLNEYIYVFNNLTLPYVGVSGIFDDVRALQNFKCNCGTAACYDDDMEYPRPREIQQKIIQSILSVELRIQVRPDDKLVQVDAPNQT